MERSENVNGNTTSPIIAKLSKNNGSIPVSTFFQRRRLPNRSISLEQEISQSAPARKPPVKRVHMPPTPKNEKDRLKIERIRSKIEETRQEFDDRFASLNDEWEQATEELDQRKEASIELLNKEEDAWHLKVLARRCPAAEELETRAKVKARACEYDEVKELAHKAQLERIRFEERAHKEAEQHRRRSFERLEQEHARESAVLNAEFESRENALKTEENRIFETLRRRLNNLAGSLQPL